MPIWTNVCNAVLPLCSIFKTRKVRDKKPPSGLNWCREGFADICVIEILVPSEVFYFQVNAGSQEGGLVKSLTFLSNWKRATWVERWKENLHDGLTADAFSGPSTLGTDTLEVEDRISFLNTLHTHMILGKFSCPPIHKDHCFIWRHWRQKG